MRLLSLPEYGLFFFALLHHVPPYPALCSLGAFSASCPFTAGALYPPALDCISLRHSALGRTHRSNYSEGSSGRRIMGYPDLSN
jgi:hypothetical protein